MTQQSQRPLVAKKLQEQCLATAVGAVVKSLSRPVGLIGLLLAGAAQADDQLGYLKPYVGINLGYDDNVVRLDDQASLPASIEDRSSTFQKLEVGADARTYVGQQQLNFTGSLWRQRYDDIDALDYTGIQAKAAWKIKAGENWKGQLYYDFSRMLREFEYLSVAEAGIRESGTIGVRASRALGYRHQVEVFASHADVSIERDRSIDVSQDVDRDVLGARYTHALTAGNRVGAEIRYLQRDGDTQLTNNDFEQTSVGPFLQWAVGAKSRLDAFVGYANRKADDRNADDYSGLVADVEFSWQASTKSALVASAWRKASNLNDEISNYALVQGLKLEPTWQASEKLSFSAFGTYENRDFRGGTGRDDDVFKAGAAVTWLLPKSLRMTLRYEHGDRDSSRALTDFDFNTTSLELQLRP